MKYGRYKFCNSSVGFSNYVEINLVHFSINKDRIVELSLNPELFISFSKFSVTLYVFDIPKSFVHLVNNAAGSIYHRNWKAQFIAFYLSHCLDEINNKRNIWNFMISFILILTQFLACILINFEDHENLAVVVF